MTDFRRRLRAFWNRLRVANGFQPLPEKHRVRITYPNGTVEDAELTSEEYAALKESRWTKIL